MQTVETADLTIRLDDLGYEVGGQSILSGVTLCSSARSVGVVGRNGSGKSTLARLLAGLVKPTAGRIRVADVDIFHDRRAALETVGILFQNPEHQIIFPRVSEEIAFGLRQQGLNKTQAVTRCDEVLHSFDKLHWRDAPISALSQGQKHLVCMMAVMAMRPRLLILDEPYAGLDIPTRRQLGRYLLRARARLFHISHEPADLEACDEIFWRDRGRIVAQGTPAQVLPDFSAEMIRLGDLDDIADLADWDARPGAVSACLCATDMPYWATSAIRCPFMPRLRHCTLARPFWSLPVTARATRCGSWPRRASPCFTPHPRSCAGFCWRQITTCPPSPMCSAAGASWTTPVVTE